MHIHKLGLRIQMHHAVVQKLKTTVLSVAAWMHQTIRSLQVLRRTHQNLSVLSLYLSVTCITPTKLHRDDCILCCILRLSDLLIIKIRLLSMCPVHRPINVIECRQSLLFCKVSMLSFSFLSGLYDFSAIARLQTR